MAENNRSGEGNRQGRLLWLIAGVIVLGIVFLGAWAKTAKSRGAVVDQHEEEQVVLVRTKVMEGRRIADTVRLPGRALPIREAVLSTEKAGRITRLHADKGQVVAPGQLLASLDDRAWKAQEKQAIVQEREARNDLVRWDALKKSGAVSDDDFEATKARLDMAVASRESASVSVSQCSIKAPFAGVINDRYGNEGEYAAEGIPVFKLIDVSRIKVAVSIPERDIGSVELGAEMTFSFAAIPGQVFTGVVSFVSQQADRMSNSFDVELVADNRSGAIKAGMIARVSFARRVLDSAVVVPLATVIPQKGDDIVFIVKDGRAVRRVVRIESWFEDEAMIASGLSIGEEIIVAGHKGIQDGMKVRKEVMSDE